MRKIQTSGQQKFKRQLDRERQERTAVYDHQWRQFSANYRKANPFCVECLKDGVYNDQNTHTDHIIPLEQRPDLKYDVDNLQVLCRSCHSRKSWKEKLADRH